MILIVGLILIIFLDYWESGKKLSWNSCSKQWKFTHLKSVICSTFHETIEIRIIFVKPQILFSVQVATSFFDINFVNVLATMKNISFDRYEIFCSWWYGKSIFNHFWTSWRHVKKTLELNKSIFIKVCFGLIFWRILGHSYVGEFWGECFAVFRRFFETFVRVLRQFFWTFWVQPCAAWK